MNTLYLTVNGTSDDIPSIQQAAAILKSGGLVAFPTETVYGLGANALDQTAAQRIYAAKGRPSDNPLIVHVAEPMDYLKYAIDDPEGRMKLLCSHFMPGPLTVVLSKKPCIPYGVTGGLDTVAIRCPQDPVAHAMLKEAGLPIAAPSANTSGRPSPTKWEHVKEDLDGRVDAVLCSGASSIGLESTILSLVGTPTLLRPGYVTVDQLEKVIGPIAIDKAVLHKLEEGERPLAPGMKYRHYAPRARVVMVYGEDKKVLSFMKEKLSLGHSVICFEEDMPLFSGSVSQNCYSIGHCQAPEEQAACLFDVLRTLDARQVKQVYSRMPSKQGVGLAVFNRLIKACGFECLNLE